MIFLLILFIIGIFLLLTCADLFIDGASILAKRFHISTAAIGFTVVAFGTSLPEFVISMRASVSGNSSLVLGNVIGSNVANIALVLGLCSLLAPHVWRDGHQRHQGIVLMFIATSVFIFIALNGTISHIGGAILLFTFAIALGITWMSSKEDATDNSESTVESEGYRDGWMTILGFAGVIIGAQMVVSSAEEIAQLFGVSDFIIGVTIIAIGTSLPELVTSFIAIMRGEFAISAGNILGSNLFNLLMIVGASAMVLPLTIPDINDLVLLAVFTIAVLPLLTGKAIITRVWGGILLIAYFGYILYYAGILISLPK